MNNSEFLFQLSSYIQTVFDNEELFIRDVLAEDKEDIVEIVECYMAGARTRLVGINEWGYKRVVMVPTQDLIEWCEDVR